MRFTAPEPLAPRHNLRNFASGVTSLDDWLGGRAFKNQAADASRTFVVSDADRVVAYYAIASGGVQSEAAPGRFRRNMPDPIPVAILARLAVDRAYQGRGLGRALLRDCALRVIQAADTIGIRGILVHATSEDAKAFYLASGFEPSPLEPMTLMTSLADLRSAL